MPSETVSAAPREFVFIDAGVPNLDQLLAGLRDGMQAVLLTADADPLLQIRDALAGRSDVDAIHIVAHGEPGALTFLGGRLSSANVESYAEVLREIGASLTDAGDILLWSCDTGRGDLGQDFVAAIARLTGADVAASDNLTGAAFLGGDWNLEVTTGDIEAQGISPQYDAVLAPSGETFDGYVGFTASGTSFALGDFTYRGDGTIDAMVVGGDQLPANTNSDGPDDRALLLNYGGGDVSKYSFETDGRDFQLRGFDIGVGAGSPTNVTLTVWRDGGVVLSENLNLMPDAVVFAGDSSNSSTVQYVGSHGPMGGYHGTISFAPAVIGDLVELSFGAPTSLELDSIDYDLDVAAAPPTPSAPDLDTAYDSGISTTDDLTGNYTLAFNGTDGVDGAAVTVWADINDNGQIDVGEAAGVSSVSGDGWTVHVDVTGLTDGSYNFKALQQVDGVDSSASAGLTVTIDRAAPQFDTSAPSLAGQTDVAPDAQITLTFTEAVYPGPFGTFYLYDNDAQSFIAYVPNGSPGVTGWGTTTLTIDPGFELPAGANISLWWDGMGLMDAAGNVAYGNFGSDSYTFKVAETAPVVTAVPQGGEHVEDGLPVQVFADVTVQAGGPTQSYDQLVFTVENVENTGHEYLYIDSDWLSLTDGTSIVTTFGYAVDVAVEGTTATVTLSKSSGIYANQVEGLLEQLQYSNGSEAPTGEPRIFSFTSLRVTGADEATPLDLSASVAVKGTNDAPELFGGHFSAPDSEQYGGPPEGQVGSLVSESLEHGVQIVDVDGSDGWGIAINFVDEVYGTWHYSVDDGATWEKMPTLSHDQVLLLRAEDRIYFEPNADSSSYFHFFAWDGSGDTAGRAGEVVTFSDLGGTSPFSWQTGTLWTNVVNTMTPPVPSAPVLHESTDSGKSQSDNLTNQNLLIFTGTATSQTMIKLYVDGVDTGVSVLSGIDGTYTINYTATSLDDGPHVFTTTAINGANESAAGDPLTVTLDRHVAPPEVALHPDSDTGSAGDGITADPQPTFAGTGDPGGRLGLFVDGGYVGETEVDDDGNWTLAPNAPLEDGTYQVYALQYDAAGNLSGPSATFTVTIDTAAGAPTIGLHVDSNTGSTADTITADTTPTITGTAEAGASVEIILGGGTIGTVTADGDGVWSYTPTSPLPGGYHQFQARQTDAAGNQGPLSEMVSVQIMTAAPVVFAPRVGVTENTPVGSFVTQVMVMDSDIGDTHTFALVDNPHTPEDESQLPFAIDSEGQITVAGPIDFEQNERYTLRVQVTDSAGLVTETDLQVRVNDVTIGDTYVGTSGTDIISFPGTSGYDAVDGREGHDFLTVEASRIMLAGSVYLGDKLGFSLDLDGVGGYETLLTARNIETVMLHAEEIRVSGNLTHAGLDTNGLYLVGTEGNSLIDGTEITSDHRMFAKGAGGDDLIRGSKNDDILSGDLGDDTLEGGAGNDLLHGGEGADRLDGGAGDDVLMPGSGADTVIGGTGIDTISYMDASSKVAVSLATGTGSWAAAGLRVSQVENVTGSFHDDFLKGDAGNNRLEGGFGDDRLEGGAGDDVLIGGQGADILIGGAGIDTADYSDEAGPVEVSLLTGTGGLAAAGDTLSQIENVIGSAYDDLLKGDAKANRLEGGAGNDRLEGEAGDDVLDGGAGDDVLMPGSGADTVIGGTGIDTISYMDASSKVAVSLATGTGSWAAAGLRVSQVENVTGSFHADFLKGDAGNNRLDGGFGDDRLEGGAGDDALVGGQGADILIGGAGIDTADYSGANDRVSVSLASGKGYLGDAAGDTLSQIENVIGSAYDDFLKGDAKANRLQGGAGNDRLEGEAGDDVLIGGDGADVLNGGEGIDTVDYSATTSNVAVSLHSGTGSWGAAGDTYIQVENVVGSAFDDYLKGDNGANRLEGGAGDDRLEGRGGNDILEGGRGNDILVGGAGSDRFVFANQAGNDTVTDFTAGAGTPDILDFATNSFLNSFADVMANATQVGGDTLIVVGGGDVLTLLGVDRSMLHQDDFAF